MNITNKKDVVAIGNAMVDVFIKSDLELINSYGLNRDSMNLIDENKKNQLHKENSFDEMVAAGSAGNTVVGISSFGGNGTFIGKINNDEIGDFFNLATASPDRTGCVAMAVTDFAPSFIEVSAALQSVPAVSIISSIMSTCLFFKSPTRFTTSTLFFAGLRLSINAKLRFSFFAYD